eukprot:366024-Chlamydomonas_euryale.AAC.12
MGMSRSECESVLQKRKTGWSDALGGTLSCSGRSTVLITMSCGGGGVWVHEVGREGGRGKGVPGRQTCKEANDLMRAAGQHARFAGA